MVKLAVHFDLLTHFKLYPEPLSVSSLISLTHRFKFASVIGLSFSLDMNQIAKLPEEGSYGYHADCLIGNSESWGIGDPTFSLSLGQDSLAIVYNPLETHCTAVTILRLSGNDLAFDPPFNLPTHIIHNSCDSSPDYGSPLNAPDALNFCDLVLELHKLIRLNNPNKLDLRWCYQSIGWVHI